MSINILKFKHPFTCIVAGSTSSGKTIWTRNLLEYNRFLITLNKTNLKVLWCYGVYQDIYKIPINSVEIVYFNGLPNIDIINENKPDVIILDDLMNEINNDKTVKDMFIKFSHHWNISVIFIVQNIFNKDKYMRTISLNSHYIVIMRGVRLTQQIGVLGNQIFPGKTKKIIEIFKRATKENYSYLIFDLHPQSVDRFRIRNRIFKSELPECLKKDLILYQYFMKYKK